MKILHKKLSNCLKVLQTLLYLENFRSIAISEQCVNKLEI